MRRFERVRKASRLAEKEQVSQIHTLIYTMGDEAEDILSSFRLTAEQLCYSRRKVPGILREEEESHLRAGEV